MKTLKKLKSKIIIFLFALILPLSATSIAYSTANLESAKADSTTSTNYYSGYMKEVTMTNNNFNSSSSTYSMSTSLSGWTGQISDKKSTAGIIDVGVTFQNHMTGTYRLSQNPGAKATDKKVLMINSKYADSTDMSYSRQGYKSSSISLNANSYYSFQVSFKSDTNYKTNTTYVPQKAQQGELPKEVSISYNSFKKVAFDEYVSFSRSTDNKTFYFHKTLNEAEKTAQDKVLNKSTEVLYEDEQYIGYIDSTDETKIIYVEKVEENITDQTYTVSANTQTYTSYFRYDKNSKTFTAPIDTEYYMATTTYDALNYYSFGSIYLSGLKDENGNPVKAEYVKVSTGNWTTFYFFVATGNEKQTVTLDLWLGSQVYGQNSSGVVFFDDVHVYQYSENNFWKIYKSYYGKSYTKTYQDQNGDIVEENVDCLNLIDLRKNDTISYPAHNFDFEEDIYQNGTSVKNWKKSGTGHARVFNTNAPQAFKSTTGYDFVGSMLTCDVELDQDLKPTINTHNHVLGLWADDEYVEVKSNDISIASNEILKVTANYKVSEISTGNVYLAIEENDNVRNAYNISESQYALKDKTYSSGTSSNGSNSFNNNYGTIEFYVKGGVHYDSSFNIVLSLGKTGENATGCVTFDNIKVEKATTESYESASNKVEFDAKSGTQTITNGNFNNVIVSGDFNEPYAPKNWTIETEESGLNFAGVINTQKYEEYVEKYKAFRAEGLSESENPYTWALEFTNPKNSNNSTTSDNIMMLANLKESYQSIKSETIKLEAGKISKIDFMLKTTANSKTTISVFGSDGFEIYKTSIGTNSEWKNFEIYLNAISGANEIYFTIELGTQNNPTQGALYLDNFNLSTDISSSVFENKTAAVEGVDMFAGIDMTDFYLNLPTNNITTELSTSVTPAYKTTLGSKQDGVEIDGGIINSKAFDTNNKFFIESNEDKNVFFITSTGVGSYSIDSNYKLDLKSGNYYKLSFKLKTNFAYTNQDVELDSEKSYSYGVTVGLSGFDYATGLVSNDEYKTYTIYINPSEDTSSNLHISLICDAKETAGSMALYDLNLEELSEEDGKEDFENATSNTSAENYDINEGGEFVATVKEETEDSETEDDTNQNDSTNTSENNDLNWSILISSLITGAAIVIAVIGWALSKVKIKKIDRKRKESYDRKSSLNVDVIKRKAREQRDAQLNEVKSTAEKFEKELENLETTHKQRVVELREKDKGKVSKETDKEFKHFAQKRTVLAEKLASLNKQIENLQSPEYLLSLERKVYAEQESKRKELAKASKKQSEQNSDSNQSK